MRRTSKVTIDQRRARERGFTLIELMIAMTLGLLVVAGVGFVYLGSAQAYRTQDSMARLQESARYAFELIGRDLRMAGTAGCSYSSSNIHKALATNDWYGDLFTKPLSSEDTTGTADTQTQYSDALRILRADTSKEYVVQAHDLVASRFTLTAATKDLAGQLLVATNCSQVALFQSSDAAGAAASTTVSHAQAGTPGNVDGTLNGATAFTAGSRLYRLDAVTYFVKLNSAGVPALYRAVPKTPPAAEDDEQELIEGVQDFQISYAVDTNLPAPDGNPDFVGPAGGSPYLSGDQIEDPASVVPLSTAPERWERVVSVRVSLLMRSIDNNVAPAPQKYSYNGVDDVTPTDRYIRKVFTHVIKLRNR